MTAASPDLIDLQVTGFRSVEVRPTPEGYRASCVVKYAGGLYFIYLELPRRDDGTLREKVFSRRIETFCGRPVRGRVGPKLWDLADEAANAALDTLEGGQ